MYPINSIGRVLRLHRRCCGFESYIGYYPRLAELAYALRQGRSFYRFDSCIEDYAQLAELAYAVVSKTIPKGYTFELCIGHRSKRCEFDSHIDGNVKIDRSIRIMGVYLLEYT